MLGSESNSINLGLSVKKNTIVHVITGLKDGGAEGVLYRLCLNDTHNNHIIISLTGPAKYGSMFTSNGFDVECLGMGRGILSAILAPIRLYKLLKFYSPNIVQTWMYHADLLGGIAAKLTGVSKIYWNIRHSDLEKGSSSISTIFASKACAFLSRWVPDGIICCAESAKDVHEKIGYNSNKLKVIPNGYDLNKYSPNESARNLIRKTYDVADDCALIGMVGRYDSQKDHNSLLIALSQLSNTDNKFVCFLVGRDIDGRNFQLVDQINKYGLKGKVLLLGMRTDIPDVMNALDLHILSSSYGEGFPNVVAESMACGTPCIATNVGDAKRIISDSRFICEPSNPDDLNLTISNALSIMRDNPEEWLVIQSDVRQRMLTKYSLNVMLERYNSFWQGH